MYCFVAEVYVLCVYVSLSLYCDTIQYICINDWNCYWIYVYILSSQKSIYKCFTLYRRMIYANYFFLKIFLISFEAFFLIFNHHGRLLISIFLVTN